MYHALNVLFSTAAISSHSHRVFTLGAVVTTIMNVVKCGIYSRAANIYFAASIRGGGGGGGLLNGVWCLFE